jgi:general secretion pathway protein D
MLAAAVLLAGSPLRAEELYPAPPPPPSRVGTTAKMPTKLEEIRERARKRSEERAREEAAETGLEKGGPAAPLPPEGEGGIFDKLTAETVEDGLGAKHVPLGRGEKINFNFTDAELPELVKAISVATGRRFIVTGKVRSLKASLYSPFPVSPGEAYQAFLSVLAANGMSVVPSGRYLKLIESTEAVSSPVPMCRDGELCEAGDRMITRLHRLRYVSADDMSQVLTRFKTADGDITAYAPTNTLIITDYSSNVRRMLRIVQELDVEGIGTNIWIEPIYYASAGEIAGLISQLYPAEAAQQAAPGKAKARVRPPAGAGKRTPPAQEGRDAETVGQESAGERLRLIIPDERTNQLIIVASERTYLQILELIRALDTPLGEADGEIRVHKLQHADAEELSSTLSSLSGRAAPAKGKAGKAAKADRPDAASLFEGEVQITADKATNSLIIVGSARDYLSLRQVIGELDIERRQVFVEAVIMEVSIDGQRRWGVAFHGGTDLDVEAEDAQGVALGLLGTSFDSGQLNSLLLDPSMLQGLALGIRGPEIQGSEDSDILPAGISIPAFGVVVQALQNSTDVNVLSTPHILAMDNEEAEIQVGQNVPVSTSFAQGAGALQGLLNRAVGQQQGAAGALGQLGGGMFPQMAIGRQNVGIKLGITPHINQFSQVRMEIQVEVSEIAGESDLGPIIGQRTAKTVCVMADQQTVVLGGLVTDNVVNGVQKVPVLGDIPVLGRLFNRTTKRTTKRNLLIFLTPYIVRDETDFRRIFARKMQERREFIDRFTAFEYHEVQPDIDYDRTNGMLEEINRAVIVIDEDAEQRRLLEEQEEPQHIPRPPLGEVSPETAAIMGGGGEEGEGDPEAPRIDPQSLVPRPLRMVQPPVPSIVNSDEEPEEGGEEE